MSRSCDSPPDTKSGRIRNESAHRGADLHARARPGDGCVRHRRVGLDQAGWRSRSTDQDPRRLDATHSGGTGPIRLPALPRANGRTQTAHPTRGARVRVRRRRDADLRLRLPRERRLPAALLHLGVPADDRALGHRRRDRLVPLPMKNRLRVLRAERDWSQGELADRLEVSRQTVNALENEKYDPSLPLAFRIASLFGMRIEDVFTPE